MKVQENVSSPPASRGEVFPPLCPYYIAWKSNESDHPLAGRGGDWERQDSHDEASQNLWTTVNKWLVAVEFPMYYMLTTPRGIKDGINSSIWHTDVRWPSQTIIEYLSIYIYIACRHTVSAREHNMVIISLLLQVPWGVMGQHFPTHHSGCLTTALLTNRVLGGGGGKSNICWINVWMLAIPDKFCDYQKIDSYSSPFRTFIIDYWWSISEFQNDELQRDMIGTELEPSAILMKHWSLLHWTIIMT